MENAKHIGCMWALAVALGVGIGVANTPAVALASPADSDKGPSSGESSPSSSPGHSGPKSTATPSAKHALSDKRDAPSGYRRQPKPSDESAVTSTTERAGTRQRGGATSRTGSNSTPAKTTPKPAVVKAAAADPTVRDNSVDFTAAPVSSTTAAPAIAPLQPASIVSTLIDAVLSPFAGSAPNAPVQTPAAFTMLAFARREFEPSTTVDQPVDAVSTSAVDSDFISSTHNFFGLFSVTSAADPDDDHYVAFVLTTPFFTNVLTSGTDPEDNLGFGAASIGVAGQTVNTFISPFLNFSVAIPITDPFAELFTELVRLGF
jgi:hypothetical protein